MNANTHVPVPSVRSRNQEIRDLQGNLLATIDENGCIRVIQNSPELLNQLEKTINELRRKGLDTEEVAEMQFVLSRARGDV